MTGFRIVLATGAAIAAVCLAAPSLAHPEHETTKEEVREIKIVHADGKKRISKSELVADCGKGRKFESSATSGDGTKEKHVNKMVLCSDPGESDEAWAKILRDALARVEANEDMSPEGKAQIMADLRTEIAKLGQ